MIICQKCQSSNREGTLFCDECGANLFKPNLEAPLQTRIVRNQDGTAMFTKTTTEAPSPFQQPDHSSANGRASVQKQASWQASRTYQKGFKIYLQVKNQDAVFITPKSRIIFGRADPQSDDPDVDLTPFDALENGVSRVHAALILRDEMLMIEDSGSSNGTYLNGQRLPPNQPRIIRDGDEICLGRLVANVYFKNE